MEFIYIVVDKFSTKSAIKACTVKHFKQEQKDRVLELNKINTRSQLLKPYKR